MARRPRVGHRVPVPDPGSGRLRLDAEGEVRGLDPDLAARWLEALFGTSLLFTGLLDAEGHVLAANELSVEGIGMVRAEVMGRPFWECGWWAPDAEVRDDVEAWCRTVVTTGRPLRVTSRFFRGDGSQGVTDLSLAPLHGPNGVEHIVASGNDITDAVDAQRQAETRLRRLSQVSTDLVHAQSVDDLARIVINEGLPVLGADGGAVIVRGDEALELAVSDRFGESAQLAYGRLPLDSPLPAAHTARTGERVVLPTQAEGVAFAAESAEVYEGTGRKAWVCEPLAVRDEVLGALAVAWVEEREFSDDELALVSAFAAQCAQALGRIRAAEAEQEAELEVLRLSDSLQRALLSIPAVPEGLDIAARYLPAVEAAQVGGDWYDAFETMDGATVVSVGDVFGHDGAAAAVMAQVRNLLRGLAVDTDDRPAAVLTRLEGIMAQLGVPTLSTAVVARIEPPEPGSACTAVRWSSAGHLPPLVRSATGEVTVLDGCNDRLLGAGPGPARRDQLLELPPGAALVLYTDGLVERRDEPIDDGIARLVDALGALEAGSADHLCDGVLDRVLAVEHEDDVAVLVVRT
jgi:PAS domain S-box-containing protein